MLLSSYAAQLFQAFFFWSSESVTKPSEFWLKCLPLEIQKIHLEHEKMYQKMWCEQERTEQTALGGSGVEH